MPEPRIDQPSGRTRSSDFSIELPIEGNITISGTVTHDDIEIHDIAIDKEVAEIEVSVGGHTFSVETTGLRCLKSWPIALRAEVEENIDEIASDIWLGG